MNHPRICSCIFGLLRQTLSSGGRLVKTSASRLILPVGLALTVCELPAANVVDFSAETPVEEWQPDRVNWRVAVGAWSMVETEAGTNALRSSAISQSGDAQTSYCFLDLEAGQNWGTKFRIIFRVLEVGEVATQQNAVLYFSFTKDAPIGSAPETLITIVGLPTATVRSRADSAEDFGFRFSSPVDEGVHPKEVWIAQSVMATEELTLTIEIDEGGQTARASLNDDTLSQPVALTHPWTDVKFLRIFQRGLVLEIIRVEIGD